jgi:very-long-chain (3R)-3-hydroxyacyl-CoA dehydratase
MIQWGGWFMIFADILSGFSSYGVRLVYFFQLLALLEIFHALTGIVRSSAVTTTIQVIGRLQVLYVHWRIADARGSSGVLPMVLAWTLVEIVRYLYLALKVIKLEPYFILWLRYSLFYVLYPIGVYGEMKVLYDALPGIDASGLHRMDFPNAWNFNFSFSGYIKLFLVFAYIPGLTFQYMHMMKQRRAAFERLVEQDIRKNH